MVQGSFEDTKKNPKDLTPSITAEQMVQSFEGCELFSYQDATGKWTVGYGHTGADVVPGLAISQSQALEFLEKDLIFAGRCVSRLVTVPLTQHEYDALVDFVFNLGCGTFFLSTMRKLLNSGEYQSAALEFAKWDHASGKVIAGLLRRREAEAQTFDDV